MPSGFEDWDKVMSRGKGNLKKRSVGSTGDGRKEGGKKGGKGTASGLLQSCG